LFENTWRGEKVAMAGIDEGAVWEKGVSKEYGLFSAGVVSIPDLLQEFSMAKHRSGNVYMMWIILGTKFLKNL